LDTEAGAATARPTSEAMMTEARILTTWKFDSGGLSDGDLANAVERMNCTELEPFDCRERSSTTFISMLPASVSKDLHSLCRSTRVRAG
jgi:hypothetical protein